MLDLLLIAMARPMVAPTKDQSLQLCRPVLERHAEGDIQTIDVRSVATSRSGLTIRGRLTAFLRMGPVPPGSARTHHLVRAEFDYSCTVRSGRVRAASAKPLQ